MAVLHPNPSYNQMCYKGTALYLSEVGIKTHHVKLLP